MRPIMTQVIQYDPSTPTIHIQGDLDALGVERIRDALASLVEEDDGDMTLDLSGVSFIDSSGIGAIVYLFKRLNARDRTLTLTGANPQPLQLFRMLHIDRTVTVEEARQ